MRYLIFLLLFAVLFGLVFISCNGSKKSQETQIVQDEKEVIEDSAKEKSDSHFIKDRFIVQLKGKVDPKMIVAALQKYKLELLKPISKHMNMWLFTYDTSTIEPEKMLEILKNSQYATDAEFDKNLNLREK